GGDRSVYVIDAGGQDRIFRDVLPDLVKRARTDRFGEPIERRQPTGDRVPGLAVDDHVLPFQRSYPVIEQALLRDGRKQPEGINDGFGHTAGKFDSWFKGPCLHHLLLESPPGTFPSACVRKNLKLEPRTESGRRKKRRAAAARHGSVSPIVCF